MTKQATKESTEQTVAERLAEIAKRMRIVELGDGFHIREVPAGDGESVKVWPGPFRTLRGAKILVELVSEEDGAFEYYGGRSITDYGVRQFDRQGRLRDFFEQQEGVSDPRGLARELADSREILSDYPELVEEL